MVIQTKCTVKREFSQTVRFSQIGLKLAGFATMNQIGIRLNRYKNGLRGVGQRCATRVLTLNPIRNRLIGEQVVIDSYKTYLQKIDRVYRSSLPQNTSVPSHKYPNPLQNSPFQSQSVKCFGLQLSCITSTHFIIQLQNHLSIIVLHQLFKVSSSQHTREWHSPHQERIETRTHWHHRGNQNILLFFMLPLHLHHDLTFRTEGWSSRSNTLLPGFNVSPILSDRSHLLSFLVCLTQVGVGSRSSLPAQPVALLLKNTVISVIAFHYAAGGSLLNPQNSSSFCCGQFILVHKFNQLQSDLRITVLTSRVQRIYLFLSTLSSPLLPSFFSADIQTIIDFLNDYLQIPNLKTLPPQSNLYLSTLRRAYYVRATYMDRFGSIVAQNPWKQELKLPKTNKNNDHEIEAACSGFWKDLEMPQYVVKTAATECRSHLI